MSVVTVLLGAMCIGNGGDTDSSAWQAEDSRVPREVRTPAHYSPALRKPDLLGHPPGVTQHHLKLFAYYRDTIKRCGALIGV